jgi:catechol 2,3-dioxygenase-like lactoylglutathione lyase family enzyme
MARIKHVAIRTADPEKTAAFYQDTFGLKRAGLGKNGIYLTDGHINLAILKGGDKLGIEHLGFQVDDVDAALARVAAHGGKPLGERVNVTPTDATNPQSYFEIKCLGPDDQIIDVSGSGWVGTD